MANGIKHPFTGALYEQDGEGVVLVSQGERSGRFTGEGKWLEGDLKECDPQLCGWFAGPILMNHRVAKN